MSDNDFTPNGLIDMYYEADCFDELPEEVQDALLDWFNYEETTNIERERLFQLYMSGRFRAWECPTCGDMVYDGEPEDWRLFQGVSQVDFTSFPGNPDNPLNHWMCDHCRMTDRNIWGVRQ